MRRIFNYTLLLLLLTLLSCSQKKKVSKEELEAYVFKPENGLLQKQTLSGIEVGLTYRPGELLIAQEARKDSISKKELDTLNKKYDNLYFVLSLSKDGKEVVTPQMGFGNYSEMVQVLSFRIGEYARLITPSDTLTPSDFIFERTYGMGAVNSILFAFEKKKLKGKWDWMDFQLTEFGLGTGNIRFHFENKDIESIPKINWKMSN